MRTDNSSFSNCDSIAIMGGTFDPIHFGHLVTAEAVRHEFQIQKVLFIPTGSPPHKDTSKVSDSEHRYLMSVLATVTNPFFEVSRIEIEREGSTYTIDTIKQLHDICLPKTKIFFITGADAIEQILTWKNTEELLSLCSFIAVSRPGFKKRKLIENIDNISNNFESKIHFLEVPALSISSTDIRNRVNTGQPIKYLLPEAVENYIYKHRLYKETVKDLQ